MGDDLRFEHRMSDADALMWSIEKDPLLRSTITAVATFDRPPDRKVLAEALERTSRAVPRLRQRVVGNPYSLAPPRWEVDPNFDLDYHLRWLRCSGDGSLRDLLDIAEPIAMQGFDRARPLWEFVVVDGLEGDRAGAVIKLHHSITDGVGAIKIGMHLFDLERDGWRDKPGVDAPEVHVLSPMERLVDGIEHERRRQVDLARRTLGSVARTARAAVTDVASTAGGVGRTVGSLARMLAPVSTPLSPIMTGRSLSVHFDSISVPVAEMKAAAKVAGGSLNDAFVAAVLGGMRRYHDRHGASAEALRMTMPINVRNDDTADLAGNQFVPARFTVPLDIADPVARMAEVHDLVAQQRAEPALAFTGPIAGLLFRLPTSVSTGIFGAMLKGIDLVTSNVPGVPIPVFVAGAQLESQFAFGPMTGASTNITLLSYIDTVHVAVNSDPAAIPDSDAFQDCLEEGFDEIRALAG